VAPALRIGLLPYEGTTKMRVAACTKLLHKNKPMQSAFVGPQYGVFWGAFKALHSRVSGKREKHLILNENNDGNRLRTIHANLRPMGNIKNFRFRWQTSTKEVQRKCHKVQTRRPTNKQENRRANTNSIKAEAKVLPGFFLLHFAATPANSFLFIFFNCTHSLPKLQ